MIRRLLAASALASAGFLALATPHAQAQVAGPSFSPLGCDGINPASPANPRVCSQLAGQVVPIVPSNTFAAASFNAAELQTALNKGGTINVVCNGVAYSNATLFYYSNTIFNVLPGCTLESFAGLNAPLMQSGVSASVPATSVTTSWTSGQNATVTWPNHGLSTGDAVWIYNASGSTAPAGQTSFIGTFEVLSVTDANNFVVRMASSPTANASFALTAAKAINHVTLTGTFDGNYANNSQSTGIGTQLFVNAGVNDITTHLTLGNTKKYLATFEAVNKYNIDVTCYNNVSDCVKVYGPATNGVISRVVCNNNDDCISFQPKESAGFTQYPMTEGDIVGVTGGNIYSNYNTAAAGVFTVYAHGVYKLDNISISGVTANNPIGYGAYIASSADQASAYIGKISVTGITGLAQYPAFVTGITAGNVLNINALTLGLQNTSLPSTLVGNGFSSHAVVTSTTSIGTYTLQPYLSDTSYGSSGTVYYASITGNVQRVVIDQPYLNMGTNVRFFGFGNQTTTTTVNEIDVNGGFINGSRILETLGGTPGFTQTPELHITGVQATVAMGVSLYASANVNFVNDMITNASFGMLRFNGSFTANVRSSNTVLGGSSIWVTAPSGSPTMYSWSPEIKLDVTQAYVGRAIGGAAYNTNAGAGTLGQAGVVDSISTASGGWKLRGGTGSY